VNIVDSVIGSHAALTEADKTVAQEQVREQLERLLANPYFSHSRRFPSFLRFVVEHTLSGQTDLLKERTLGIEIFGKNADYDTASDPIVRVTAAEIRKRIAQYYQEAGHEHELRLSLAPGTYIPQFHWPQTQIQKDEPALVVAAEPLIATLPSESKPQPHRSHRWIWLTAVLILIVSAGGVVLWRSLHHSAFNFFWNPVLNSSDPVLFCIADQNKYSEIALRDSADPSQQVLLKDNLTAVVIDDLSPIVKIAGILQANGKKYRLLAENDANLTDLRSGPTIFVGAFDNAWTLRLTRQLRYHFSNTPEMTQFGIVDSSAPSQNRWVVDRQQQMAVNNYRDYAIVARFTDSTTGKLAIVAAGIGRGGTIAAGEFLTDPANLVQLQRAAQGAGDKKNIEIVLSTQIIGGRPGTPRIEASYFW
jgi:hypothetical protein